MERRQRWRRAEELGFQGVELEETQSLTNIEVSGLLRSRRFNLRPVLRGLGH
jgi:hypothetical protein